MESTTSPDRASLYFTSPYLERDIFASERLAMMIFTADEKCELALVGRVPLAKDLESGQPVHVEPHQTLYLKLWYRNSDGLSGTVNQRSGHVALTPNANTTYELRHIDNPGAIRIEAYQIVPDQKPLAIALGSWQDCSKTQ